MGLNKESSFNKLRTMGKYKDLFDIKSRTVWFALLFAIMICIFWEISSKYLELYYLVEEYEGISNTIGIALIGFLGFIVSALAILTGTISSNLVHKLSARNKLDSLERIMLSFYLEGIVCSALILVSFILRFIKILPIKSWMIIDIVIVFLYAYLFAFSILYAVKLIGTSIELFFIVSGMELLLSRTENSDKSDNKNAYNELRILALEKQILNSNEQVMQYKKDLEELINSQNSIEQKNGLKNLYKQHFGE